MLNDSILNLDVDKIHESPTNPRQTQDGKKLHELRDSISQKGVLQPILVRPNGSEYELVFGHRRLRITLHDGDALVAADTRTGALAPLLPVAHLLDDAKKGPMVRLIPEVPLGPLILFDLKSAH